jgi:hypothetical protein
MSWLTSPRATTPGQHAGQFLSAARRAAQFFGVEGRGADRIRAIGLEIAAGDDHFLSTHRGRIEGNAKIGLPL